MRQQMTAMSGAGAPGTDVQKLFDGERSALELVTPALLPPLPLNHYITVVCDRSTRAKLTASEYNKCIMHISPHRIWPEINLALVVEQWE